MKNKAKIWYALLHKVVFMDEEDCSSITRNVLGQSASVVNNVIFVWIFCDNTGQMKNTIYHHHCLACCAVESFFWHVSTVSTSVAISNYSLFNWSL